jgi:hypothetical protein
MRRKYTMSELLKALDADWVGYEAMRRDFLAAPKYGNDIDELTCWLKRFTIISAASATAAPTPTAEGLFPMPSRFRHTSRGELSPGPHRTEEGAAKFLPMPPCHPIMVWIKADLLPFLKAQ